MRTLISLAGSRKCRTCKEWKPRHLMVQGRRPVCKACRCIDRLERTRQKMRGRSF